MSSEIAECDERSRQEFAPAWERLLYEIKMVFGTARALWTIDSGRNEDRRIWATRNALAESFSIHARVLVDVLYANRVQSGGVLAEGFFDNLDIWRQERPEKSVLLGSVNIRMDEPFTRPVLSGDGMAPEVAAWDYTGIARDIRQVLRKFLSLVPAHAIRDESRLYALSILAEEIPSAGGEFAA